MDKIVLLNPEASIKRVTVSEAKQHKVAKLPNEMWMKIMSYLKNEDIFDSFAISVYRKIAWQSTKYASK